jgi:hypothetical protein
MSFAANKDKPMIHAIEKLTGQPILTHTIPGLEPSLKGSVKPKVPPRKKRGMPFRFKSKKSGPPHFKPKAKASKKSA